MAKEGTLQLAGQNNPDVADINKGRIFWDTGSDTFKQIDENGVIKDLTSENPGGNQNNVQFNNLGTLAGSDDFIFDGTAVGIGTATPDASALLDLTSINRGFIMPVMTTTQRDAIPSPATGLEIYNITTNEPEFFDGSIWLNTGGTAAGGSDTQIQFNNNGAFGGISGVTTSGSDIKFADATNTVWGDDDGLVAFRTGTTSRITNNTGNFELITGGEFLIDNTSITGDIVNRLGTTSSATSFEIHDNLSTVVMKVQADGRVGIGETNPDSILHISQGNAGTIIAPVGTLIVENNSNVFQQFLTPDINASGILFGNVTRPNSGSILYNDANALLGFDFRTDDDTTQMVLTSQGKLGIGTISPVASSLLQLNSTTTGFLMQRLTTTQRDAIPTPATGLQIYNITTNEPEFFDGSIWLNTGGTAAGGSDTQIQFNNNGAFDGIAGATTDGTNINIEDVANINFGDGGDLKIEHTGTNSLIQNITGDLLLVNQGAALGDIIIENLSATNDIIARLGTDGFNTKFVVKNASNAEVFSVDGAGDGKIAAELVINGQLSLEHAGAASRISSSTGEFTIDQAASADLIIENLSSTDDILMRLATNTVATKFEIQDAFLDDLFTVQGDGKVGIGIDTPDTNLHIFNESAGIVSAAANTILTVENNTDAFISILSPPGDARGILFGDSDSNTDASIVFNDTIANGLNFRTLGFDRMTISNSGSVGINNPNPDTTLHVQSATSGVVQALANTVITAESAGNNFLSLLSPNGLERSIIFGEPSSNNIGSIRYSGPNASQGLDFQVNSLGSVMVIDNSGAVGIGTTSVDASALLQLDSTTRGFLPPRMTTIERDLIPSPATGLIIYNITTNELEFFNGTEFEDFHDTLETVLEHDNNSSGNNINMTTTDLISFNNVFTINHTGANARIDTSIGDLELFVGSTGDDLALINESVTNDILAILGTGTNATAFRVQDNNLNDLFTIQGDGNANFIDSNTANWGPNQELQINHDGINALISNTVGDIEFGIISAGNFFFDNKSVTNGSLFKLGTNSETTSVRIQDVNSDDLMVVQGDGDVGINTSTPDSRLQVVDNTAPAASVLGVSWTSQTAPSNAWQGVTYGNNLYVAIAGSGNGNRVMTSPDGVTWTSRISAEDNNWRTIVFANGLFVALSNDGDNRVMTSPDGITWTARLAATQSSWKSVTFGNGLFVAVAPGTPIMTSPDGLKWTEQTGASGGTWNEVTFGNNTFVVVGDSGIAQTSPDGITWTSRTPIAGSWKRVAFGNGLFVAVLPGGTAAMFSSDNGVNWTSSGGPNNSWRGLVFGGGFFHACANGTGGTMTSTDGDNWTELTSPASNWEYVGYGNGLFVAVAASGIPAMTRTVTASEPSTVLKLDSTTRGFLPSRMTTTERDSIAQPDTGLEIFNTTTNNPEFFDSAEWVTMRQNPGGNVNTIQFNIGSRFDGSDDFVFEDGNVGIGTNTPDKKLTIIENPATGLGTFISQTSAADLAWDDIAFGNDTFVAVATDGTDRVMRSTDNGVTWTLISTPLDATGITGIAFGGGSFVATSFGSNSMESTDNGVTWTSRAMTKSDEWTAVTFSETTNRFVAVTAAGTDPKNAFSDDGGITWTNGQTTGGGGLVNNLWNDVTWGDFNGGTFVAVANDGANRAAFSSDGDTWTQSTTVPSGTLQSITFGNGVFVGVDNDAVAFGAINTSIDGGITWVDQAAPNTNQWDSVTFGNNLFIAVGDTGTGDRAMSSPDGIFWTSETTPVDNAWTGVAFGNDRFVAVSESGTGDRVMVMPLIGISDAILDLQSTTSGFLPPRLTTIERDLVPSPVAGLELFNLDNTHSEVYDGTAFRALSQVAVNTFEIYQESDWPNAPAVAGVITIDSGRYLLKDGYTTGNRFDITTAAQVIIEGETLSPLIYVGTGILFSGTPEIFAILSTIGVLAAPGSQLFDLTGANPLTSIFIVERQTQFVAVAGTNTIGTITGFRVPSIIATIFNGFQEGITFIDGSMVMDSINFAMNLTGTSPIVNLSGNFLVGASRFVDYRGSASQPIFNIDPAIDVPVFITDNRNIFNTEFFASGITGTFSAIADASVPAEAITSVTDSSGIARFNFTAPPTLFINQEVVISAFVTNTDYNGTFLITATGANFFEVSSIAFGSNETGSFLSNSVTLTSTAHGFSDGQTMLITDTLNYNGGATIYNALTNSFQINRTFTIDESGGFDTGSLTETSPFMTVKANPGQADSTTTIEAIVDDLSVPAVVVIPAIDALVITTNVNAWATSSVNRMLMNTATGNVKYVGLEDVTIKVDGEVTVEPVSGGTQQVTCRYVDCDSALNIVVTFTNGTNLINETGTALVDGDTISFRQTAGTLPAEIFNTIIYYVINATANTFQISYTSFGIAITFTDDGSGTNSYETCALIGSIPEAPATPAGPVGLSPKALRRVSPNNEIVTVVSNRSAVTNLNINNGYIRIFE